VSLSLSGENSLIVHDEGRPFAYCLGKQKMFFKYLNQFIVLCGG